MSFFFKYYNKAACFRGASTSRGKARPGRGSARGFLGVITSTDCIGAWLVPGVISPRSLPGISGVPVCLTPPSLPDIAILSLTTFTWQPSDLTWIVSGFPQDRRVLEPEAFVHLCVATFYCDCCPKEIPTERELNRSTVQRKRWKEALEWSGRAVQDQPARRWDEGLYFLMFISVKKSRILCF